MPVAPKVSVLVPVYKVESYLMQCVDSILNQTLTDIEVLLIDEGDRDPSYAIMKFLESEDARVKIIHQKCGGYGAACNLGLAAAQGEYVSIIESDDFIEAAMLEAMYARAKLLDVDVIKTPFLNYWDKRGSIPAKWEPYVHNEMLGRAHPEGSFNIREFPQQLGAHPAIWSGLYRTSFLREKGICFIAAKGAGYVDQFFRIRTLVEADKIAWLDRAFYNYRQTNPSSSVNNWDLTAMLSRWKEIHEYLHTVDSDLHSVLAGYLVSEEYLCTFSRFFDPRRPTTERQFTLMKDNLSWTIDEVVSRSPMLDDNQRVAVARLRRCRTAEELRQTLKGDNNSHTNGQAAQKSWYSKFRRRTFPPSAEEITWRLDHLSGLMRQNMER